MPKTCSEVCVTILSTLDGVDGLIYAYSRPAPPGRLGIYDVRMSLLMKSRRDSSHQALIVL